MLASVFTTLLFAVSVVCATRSARLLGGTEANFWRLTVATVLLGLWAHLFGEGVSGPSFPWFLLSGIIGVGADVFLFQALPRIGSRLSLLIIQCFSALSASLVEWAWLGTRLTVPQLLACVVILTGVAIALAPGEHANRTRSVMAAGVGFGLLAAAGNGMGAVLSRKAYAVAAANAELIDPPTSAYQRLIGGLFVAGVCLLVVRRREVAARFGGDQTSLAAEPVKWAKAWPWVLANGVAGQTMGVSCYQWALKTTPTGMVLAIVATAPLAAIPLAAKFEGEKISLRAVVGGVVAVAGALWLVLVRTGVHHSK